VTWTCFGNIYVCVLELYTSYHYSRQVNKHY